jgi:hypothetical protein
MNKDATGITVKSDLESGGITLSTGPVIITTADLKVGEEVIFIDITSTTGEITTMELVGLTTATTRHSKH